MAENTTLNGDSRQHYGQYLPLSLHASFSISLFLHPFHALLPSLL
jgi:hypothetical protein